MRVFYFYSVKLIKRKIAKSEDDYSKPLSLLELEKKRNKILVYRKWGGLGDIINTRMIFKGIKDLNPEFHITYAVPRIYFDVLNDLPYIDNLIDCSQARINDYGYSVDISTDCGSYESSTRPNVDKQRAEIWSHISLGLIKEDFEDYHFRLNNNNLQEAKDLLLNKYNYNPGIKIAIFPKTASPIKDIPDQTLISLVDKMRNNGYEPCVIHSNPSIKGLNCTYIHDLNFKQLIHVTSLFDYVITTDTGSFHLSYSLPDQKPTLGIFGWTDGFIIGKYHKKLIVLQKHRNGQSLKPLECKCTPCWSWAGACDFYKGLKSYNKFGNSKLPVPCIGEIDENIIYDKFIELQDKYPTSCEKPIPPTDLLSIPIITNSYPPIDRKINVKRI